VSTEANDNKDEKAGDENVEVNWDLFTEKAEIEEE
jgi:hypothetical protein